MKIIFEDGREIETDNPVRELTNVILNRTMAYDNNRVHERQIQQSRRQRQYIWGWCH